MLSWQPAQQAPLPAAPAPAAAPVPAPTPSPTLTPSPAPEQPSSHLVLQVADSPPLAPAATGAGVDPPQALDVGSVIAPLPSPRDGRSELRAGTWRWLSATPDVDDDDAKQSLAALGRIFSDVRGAHVVAPIAAAMLAYQDRGPATPATPLEAGAFLSAALPSAQPRPSSNYPDWVVQPTPELDTSVPGISLDEGLNLVRFFVADRDGSVTLRVDTGVLRAGYARGALLNCLLMGGFHGRFLLGTMLQRVMEASSVGEMRAAWDRALWQIPGLLSVADEVGWRRVLSVIAWFSMALDGLWDMARGRSGARIVDIDNRLARAWIDSFVERSILLLPVSSSTRAALFHQMAIEDSSAAWAARVRAPVPPRTDTKGPDSSPSTPGSRKTQRRTADLAGPGRGVVVGRDDPHTFVWCSACKVRCYSHALEDCSKLREAVQALIREGTAAGQDAALTFLLSRVRAKMRAKGPAFSRGYASREPPLSLLRERINA